jgi:putative phosphoribosyl transferase
VVIERHATDVVLGSAGLQLPGRVTIPDAASGLVVFAHGSGSSRNSPRNVQVAQRLNERGLATLLFDLLTEDEALDRLQVFEIELLAVRLIAARRWAAKQPEVGHLPLGYFGASTGAAAALWAAADDPSVGAVVSRGGRPDLAAPQLAAVRAPTLLIVGGRDEVVLRLNEQAAAAMTCECRLAIVAGATHLFEEPGTLEVAGQLATDWFIRHLADDPAGDAHRR